MSSLVNWQKTIENMLARGVDLFLEMGPRRILSGLVRRIKRTTSVSNIEDIASLRKTLDIINKGKAICCTVKE